jgi:hypothetical protein
MAMPASGCLELRSCIAGCTCSSIGCAVCGAVQTPTSLITMSNSTGRAKCMTAYYSYAGTANKTVGICCIAATGVGNLGTSLSVSRTNCICVNPAMSVGQSVCVGFNIFLKPNACVGACANYCLICNGTTIATCNCNASTCINALAIFTLNYGDTACIINCAVHGSAGGAVQSCSCGIACSASNIVGFFAIGAAQSCCVFSC